MSVTLAKRPKPLPQRAPSPDIPLDAIPPNYRWYLALGHEAAFPECQFVQYRAILRDLSPIEAHEYAAAELAEYGLALDSLAQV